MREYSKWHVKWSILEGVARNHCVGRRKRCCWTFLGIWNMRTRYHRFDSTFVVKQGLSMVYFHGNEAAWAIPLSRSCHLVAIPEWTTKMASTAIRRRNSWISEDWTEEIKENAKHIAPWMLSTFSRGYPETVPRNRPKFWRTSSRRQPS